MDHALLVASTFCFLLGFAHTMFALGTRRYRPSQFNFSVILLGFVFQTAFLFLRGQKLGCCPLTNLFEVLIFLSWSIVLLYLLVGTAYRLSLLGAFTSPLVFVLQTFALIALGDLPSRPRTAPNPWLDLHAATSVVAYGAFALAGVAGVMYLVQERQLKTRQIHSIFFHLPPIANLAVAIHRLLLAGFALLTLGLLAGFAVGFDWLQIAWGLSIWLIYALILQAEKWKRISPRRVAQLAVIAFALTLSTLWGVSLIAHAAHT